MKRLALLLLLPSLAFAFDPPSGGGSSITTPVTIGNGGTGQTTQQAAIDALLPAQGAANGKVLGSNGSASSWTTVTSGVTTVGAFSGSAQSDGASISSTTITFGPASATVPGMVSTGTQTFAGAKTFTGAITASNLSGSNTGDVTLGAVGSSPSANSASLSGQVLTLQPADATHPGVITIGTQTIAGAKTFSGGVTLGSSGITFNDATTQTSAGLALSGTAAANRFAFCNDTSCNIKTLGTTPIVNSGKYLFSDVNDDGSGAIVQANSLSTRGGTTYTNTVRVLGNNNLVLTSDNADGVTTGVRVNSTVAVTNVGYRILAITNGNVEKSWFDYAGLFHVPQIATASLPTCDATHELGTIVWDTTLVGAYACRGSLGWTAL